ncbi:MAG TPA: hypothetical protein VD931_06675 [Baekduia sp.]|nr:hypothetical protein [Baekduia sp.]
MAFYLPSDIRSRTIAVSTIVAGLAFGPRIAAAHAETVAEGASSGAGAAQVVGEVAGPPATEPSPPPPVPAVPEPVEPPPPPPPVPEHPPAQELAAAAIAGAQGAAGTTASASPPAGAAGGATSQVNEAVTTVTAANEARTVQVLVQIQQGCVRNCRTTSMTQIGTQIATTTQQAVAEALTSQTAANTASGGSGADGGTTQTNAATATSTASNLATTQQLLIQIQQGCVIRCRDTSQVQDALQDALTIQDAAARSVSAQTGANTADGGAGALTQTNASTADATALNRALTDQAIIQIQSVCQRRCTTTTAHQLAAQVSGTSQRGQAVASAPQSVTNIVSAGGLDLTGLSSLSTQLNLAQVQSWAQSQSLNIDVVVQVQQAACTVRCRNAGQLQNALQESLLAQVTTATGAAVQTATNASTVTTGRPPAATTGQVTQRNIRTERRSVSNLSTVIATVQQTQGRADDRRTVRRAKRLARRAG